MFAIALLFAISADTVLYQSTHRLYSIAKTDGDALLLLDYESGRLSRLRPGGDGYVAGPSIGVDTPIAVRVLADDERLVIDGEQHVEAKRVDAFRTEDAGNGTLYVPASPGKHPLMIVVPGSGRATRRAFALFAPYFARSGIAVLALDKRENWEAATFADIANDVVAAAKAMQKRPDISSIGLYASSQAGWVAPIAASKSPLVSFIVCAACPMTPMPRQELIRTTYELRADGHSEAEVAQAVAYRKLLFQYLHDGSGLPQLERLDAEAKGARWYARFGGVPSRDAALVQWWRINDAFDPAASWKQVRVPALMLFGERDTRVPPREHAPLAKKATVVIVPKIDHEGFVAVTGGQTEVPSLDRIPSRAMEPAIEWVLGNDKRQTTNDKRQTTNEGGNPKGRIISNQPRALELTSNSDNDERQKKVSALCRLSFVVCRLSFVVCRFS
jgi:pimeloyl-ACP methyl ester carboxylesterase